MNPNSFPSYYNIDNGPGQVTRLSLHQRALVVTGAARSGTGYCARALSWLLQRPVGHESMAELDFECRWPRDKPPPDVSWLAAAKLNKLSPAADVGMTGEYAVYPVLLWRDPVDAVNSICRRAFLDGSNRYGVFAWLTLWNRRYDLGIEDRINKVPFPSPLYSAVFYWVHWNRMILHDIPGIKVWKIDQVTQALEAKYGDNIRVPKSFNSGDRWADAPQAKDLHDLITQVAHSINDRNDRVASAQQLSNAIPALLRKLNSNTQDQDQ